jgi:nitrate reductase gamma subunit
MFSFRPVVVVVFGYISLVLLLLERHWRWLIVVQRTDGRSERLTRLWWRSFRFLRLSTCSYEGRTVASKEYEWWNESNQSETDDEDERNDFTSL